MDFIKVNDKDIAFERAGTGPAVVLLHGGLSDSREWRRQVRYLSREFTVVAWDAPGCGRSSDPPEDFGLSGYASCLGDFIQALELEHPHIVGLSFGAGLALKFYCQRPDLPRSLVLASAYTGWAGSLPREVADARLASALEQSKMPPNEVVEQWLPDLLTADAPSELHDELRAVMVDFHPAGFRAMARAFAAADLRPVLSAVRVPTLFIYGEADRRSSLGLAQEMNEAIRDSRLVVLPGAGHQVNLEAADRFNEEVYAFISGH